jgi:hypothetical protein
MGDHVWRVMFEQAEVAALAAAVRAHEEGFCAAANSAYRCCGVRSPLGGMFDRAGNRGCYVATLLEDVCEDHFGRRPVPPRGWHPYEARPRSPAAAAMMAAETGRTRRRVPMAASTGAALRVWLGERRDLMRRAEAVGRTFRYAILATRAREEARRAGRMLDRLGPATALVAAAMAADRAGLVAAPLGTEAPADG